MSGTRTAGEAVIGAVGPADLVESLERLTRREYPWLSVQPFAYRTETEAAAMIASAADEVDAWLFTGVVPFSLSWQSGVLRHPACYVRYRCTGLPRILRPLLSAPTPPGTISIDTLPRQQVHRILRHAGLPEGRIRVLEHRPDRAGAEFVRFHRRAARDRGGSVAITCVRSVYDRLAPGQPSLRLVPAAAAVRTALRAVAPQSLNGLSGACDPAIGLVELSDPAPDLRRLTGDLAAAVVPLDETRYLLVSTRERLVAASARFRRLPLLDELRPDRLRVRLGFGIAPTAAEAERRARTAIARARTVGAFAAVVSPTEDGEVIIGSAPDARPDAPGPVSPRVAERRTGVAADALLRLEQAEALSGTGLTTADVADALGLEARASRRTVERLAAAGVFQPLETLGTISAHTVGRPRARYRVVLARPDHVAQEM